MTASPPPPPATSVEAHNQLVNQILRIRHPLHDLAAALACVTEGNRQVHEKLHAERESERAQLLALSWTELQAIRAQQIAQAKANDVARAESEKRRKAGAEAKAAQKEVAQFYNQPDAVADFEYWSKTDFWTFDEALALLLGKDPRVLTPAAMKKALAPDFSLMLSGSPPKARTGFLRTYEDLKALAVRATPMQGQRLAPANVLLWAHHSGAISLPTPLLKAVAERVRRTRPDCAPPDASGKTQKPEETDAVVASDTLKRSALISKHERDWPSLESDLRHANENGLSKAAKAEKRGYWLEDKALQWARQNGKVIASHMNRPNTAHSPFPRQSED